MKNGSTILFLCLGIILPATLSAAPGPLWNEAVSFYRSPTSPFPSGQVSRRDLEKTQKNTETEVGYEIKWGEQRFKVQTDQLIRDLQTSSWALAKNETPLRESPSETSKVLHLVRENAALTIVKSLNFWSEVYDGQKLGWVPTHDLKSVREDKGVFVAMIDTYLRSEPKQGAPILSTASKDSRWSYSRVEKEWLQVQWNGQTAYLDLAHLAHRSDFATWAFHRVLGWLPIESRAGGTVITTDGKKYALKEFDAFDTDPRKALMKDSIKNGPQIRSRVVIETFSAAKWTLSHLDGHGDVWWKKELVKETPTMPVPVAISLKELLQKDVKSMSLEGRNKSVGLASSHGIYRMIDGKSWQKISEFGDQDFPVSIHPEGPWFVGSFRSFDNGASFEPFLRWDLVTELIQNEIGHAPLYMKVVHLSALKNSQLEVTIDSGFRKIKLRGHILGQSWKVAH